MKRIIIIYNPRSSRYAEVKKEVLGPIHELSGCIIGKYEVKPTKLDDNISTFAKVLKDDDLVISAGGDATGVIAVNAILKSKKDVILSVLPYGNFNDLARTLGNKKTVGNDLLRVFRSAAARELARSPHGDGRERRDPKKVIPTVNLYPLEIWIDGEFYRYATCYVTIGMTAEAVHIYDEPKMRKALKTNFGRKIISYTELASWYFKHRHKKQFLPEFSINSKKQHPKTSDYAAINGRSMARVMKGGEDFLDPKVFRSETDRLTSLWRLIKLMTKSILFRVPGSRTTGDTLEFTDPATITLQAEGEHIILRNTKIIEIKKGTKCLKVITN